MAVTIYTITYNEEHILPYFIQHYRTNLPGCRIIVYDNHSTDSTVRIAQLHGCEVIPYYTANQLDDLKYLAIKNHCWQPQRQAALAASKPPLGGLVAAVNPSPLHGEGARRADEAAASPSPKGEGRGEVPSSWAIIADADELCQITTADLQQAEKDGITMLKFNGYNMVNMEDNTNVHTITHGVPDAMYSKSYCFDTTQISAINYKPGCHQCNPVGNIVYSTAVYPCYHYRYINAAMLVQRYQRNAQRMNQHGRRTGMGSHYHQAQAAIISQFNAARAAAKPLRQPMPHNTLKLFVTGYQPQQLQAIQAPHLLPVNLATLPLGPLQQNALSEHRLFLSDMATAAPAVNPSPFYGEGARRADEAAVIPPLGGQGAAVPAASKSPFVSSRLTREGDLGVFTGNLSWRYNQKCRHLLPAEHLWQLPLQPNVVWCAWPDNWYRKTLIDHPGIQPYLEELLQLTGLSPEGIGPVANQFICSKEVWLHFIQFFYQCFTHFHRKYGLTGFKFWVKTDDIPRTPAVFYERIAALYFANRKDLIIKQIPLK